MKRAATTVLAAMFMLACYPAAASDSDGPTFSYHYLEALYVGQSPSRTAPNFTGGALRGVFGFDNHLFLQLDFRNTSASENNNPSLEERTLGLGFARRLDENTDLVTRFDVTERTLGNDADSIDGFAFNTGLRYRLHRRLELGGFIAWRALDNDSEWLARARILGRVAGPLWLNLGVLHGEHDRGWEAGLRLTY